MRKKIRQKLNTKAGFTLAETLLAVLILLMVSSIVAAGVPAARNAYEKAVLGSNAQVLLSTTVSELRDELGTAWDVETDMYGDVYYFSADTGAKSKLYVENNRIMLQRFVDADGLDVKSGEPAPLVSDAAATRDLYVIYDNVSYDADDGVITFSGLRVLRAATGDVLAETRKGKDSLKIRVIAAAA